MSIDLGIDTKGLTNQRKEELQRSVAELIEVNQQERGYSIASEIQRRGENLSGDVGDNFGLNRSNNNYGILGLNGLNHESKYFSNPSMLGYNGSYLWTFGIQGSNSFSSRTTKLAHHKMALCVSAYKGFGVAKNVIDLMTNFASEGLVIKHPNKTVQRFYEKWAQHVDLQGRVRDILRYYYKYGNVFIYTTNGIIDKGVYDRMRRAKSNSEGIPGFTKSDSDDPHSKDRMKDAENESLKPEGEREIPWKYTLLNPFQMELRGSKFFGSSRWVFILDENTVASLKNSAIIYKDSSIDFLDESDINLPPEFVKLSKNISKSAPDGELNDNRVVDLDQRRLWAIHYMKDDHEDWADPLLWPVMSDIYYKNKLREMDMSVCNSVINAITIFKLGNLQQGYIPPKEHFSKFAEFLRTPTAAMSMVWNDSIDIVNSFPPVEKILSIAKYESVDRDILRGIGVPDMLLGGASSSNFSTGFLGVRTLLERLEEGRNTVVRWINKQLQLIATTMGHRKLPRIKFGKMSLRDEKAEKQLFLGLLDRNIVSIQSVLECFGEDFEIEIERMREEQKIRDNDDLLIQHGPYTDPMATLTDEEVMDREEQQALRLSRTRQGGNRSRTRNINGRPPNTEGIPQGNKRETKPRGMAYFINYEKEKKRAAARIEKIEGIVSSMILRSSGKKTKRSLNKFETSGIEEITFAVASHITTDNISISDVQSVLKSHGRIDDTVYLYYTKVKLDDMSLDDRKDAIASAIAMCKVENDN